ncbi:MAG TPA: HTH domain-containing protein [Bacteroidales bacterium]
MKNIIAIVEENPIITVDGIANRLHVSKATTEREIAFLKSKNILLRIDSKKAGSWKINRDQK